MATNPLITIRVKTIDCVETTLQLQQDVYHKPVSELVKAACDEIGLQNHEEFSFTLNKQKPWFKRMRKVFSNKQNDEIKFLNPKKTLKEQGINEADTLNLRKRLFYTETINCCRNEKEQNLTYLQLQNAIMTGIYTCTCDKAIELAALQCHIEYGNCNNNINENFLDHRLKSLLPRKYAKVQGIASVILEAYNSLELREHSDAKAEYIQFCTTLDGYGITFFPGRESTKKKLVKCYLGITRDSVWRVEAKSCEVLEKWPIVNIQRWNQSRNNILLTLILNNNKSYTFWPSGECTCDAIMQLLDDYAAIHSGSQSGRDSNPLVSNIIIGGDLPTVALGSDISLSHSRINSQQHVSAAISIAISSGDSATDPVMATEDPSTSNEGDISSGEINTLSVSIARGDSVINPVNSGERNTCISSDQHEGQSYIRNQRDTPISSEEDSPIHNVQDHLTITKLRSVRNRIWEARTKWKDIGIELDLKKDALDAINMTNRSDVEVCFGEMLSLWLNQTMSRPTWSKMIRALKRPAVGFQSLAEDIEMNVTKQTIDLLQFPQISEIEKDEERRKELEERLRAQTIDIIFEFNTLKQHLFDTLEDYSVQKLARYLKDCGAENLASIDDVITFMEKNSSFYDYDIVKYVIRLAGAERDKQGLQEYEKRFEVYGRRRVYECPSMIGASSVNSDSQPSKLLIKLDSEYDGIDLNKLKQFQRRLCNLLNIPMCKLISVQRGCLKLTFDVFLLEATFPLHKKQESKLIELGVLELEYRDYTYRFQLNREQTLLNTIRLKVLSQCERIHQNVKESDPISHKLWLRFSSHSMYSAGTFV